MGMQFAPLKRPRPASRLNLNQWQPPLTEPHVVKILGRTASLEVRLELESTWFAWPALDGCWHSQPSGIIPETRLHCTTKGTISLDRMYRAATSLLLGM